MSQLKPAIKICRPHYKCNHCNIARAPDWWTFWETGKDYNLWLNILKVKSFEEAMQLPLVEYSMFTVLQTKSDCN